MDGCILHSCNVSHDPLIRGQANDALRMGILVSECSMEKDVFVDVGGGVKLHESLLLTTMVVLLLILSAMCVAI